MRKKLQIILLLLTVLFLGLAAPVYAALIDLGMTSYGNETRMYQIYNALYGTGYGNNDALEFLENDALIGTGLFKSNEGKLMLAARYAGASLTMKYYDGSGDHAIVTNFPGQQILYDPPTISYSVTDDGPFGIWGQTIYGKWYSEISRNTDGRYHFLVLNTPTPGKYLVGFEDISRGSDWDYNDFVFEVYNTPEPATLSLLGLGLLGLAGFRRKGKK